MTEACPTLFKRTATQAIEQWTVTFDADTGILQTHSGQVGGVITPSAPTQCKAKSVGKKNETTPGQQARQQAASLWEKKAKTGYFQDINKIDDFYFVEPTLATPLHKVKGGIQFPCLFQTKYNGGCIIFTARGPYSREGERYLTIPHIEEALRPFFAEWPDAVLHGEAFNLEMREQLNELMKILRKTSQDSITPEILERSRELIRFYIYDGYAFANTTEETPYSLRKAMIDMYVTGSPDLGGTSSIPYCEYVETIVCNTQAEVDALYAARIADQHEGGILRYGLSPYEHKRTPRIIKLKPDHSDEGKIVAINEGDGKSAGLAATFTIGWTDKSGVLRTFRATAKGTQAARRKILSEPENWIGREATFLHIAYTGLGLPFSPRVDINNCFKKG